ncbi:MAG: hypothetical protein ABI619_00120 [Betaproteobacteria bacterium]
MKLTRKDFAALKYPVLILGITIAVSIALVKLTSDQRVHAENQSRNLLLTLQEARSRYHRSGDERENILRYLPAYQQLVEQGFVGTERRISWLEALRIANEQAGSLGVTYQLEPQKPFLLMSLDNPVSKNLQHSRMKLTIGLLHEGTLMEFFRSLAAQQPGLFMLTGCALDRASGLESPAPRQANLSAQCELSWLTIDPKKDKS